MKITLDYYCLKCECGFVLYRHPDLERATCMNRECDHYDKIFRLPAPPTIEATEVVGERDGWRAPSRMSYETSQSTVDE